MQYVMKQNKLLNNIDTKLYINIWYSNGLLNNVTFMALRYMSADNIGYIVYWETNTGGENAC